MTFDPGHVFLVAHTGQIASMTIAGAIIGYLFVARMSAHLSVREFVFRGLVIGLIFLGGMGLTRAAGGAPTWEAWIGIGVAYFGYSIGMGAGIAVWDWRLKRAMERELGRPIGFNPRGIVRPGGRRRGDQP